MDAKRILIFVILLVVLFLAGQRACKWYRIYNPTPSPVTAPPPGTQPTGPGTVPAP